ncbi:family 76 glycoside hydrolase [Plectosphaerella plurivora]|uniref:Mannan endo-1,6-alpha-mannosidase n=1 Tax=Plectosphaerella plurivora TaxID=936078 RepID=A0A9P9AAE1_9PEZI|nr:family 76 glycoside hydrolase [Plectosphaerella plurivora]
MRRLLTSSILAGLAVAQSPYSIDTREDILQSARTLAYDMMLFYSGNQTGKVPGVLPGPPASGTGDYYWWQGGAMMAAYIDYWYYTGDDSYNQVVYEGMLHQVGENKNFEPLNHTASLGNDDQGFWGMTAMLAAELGFQDPPEGQPQWLALAQAVWNRMALPERHDEFCNGGMRWQIPPLNPGYNYKNTIANACFFNIGSRLARYLGNDTYMEWAEDTWDWLWGVNYIDHDNWRVYDGADIADNCTKIVKVTYSYNIGSLLQGAAFLYNYTNGSDKWRERVDGLSERIMTDFFPNNTAYEVSCEPRPGTCTADMIMFKGFIHRWLPTVAQLAPFTAERILPVLRDSTEAAIKQCTAGNSGRVCGFFWSSGAYMPMPENTVGRTSGAGEALNVLSAVTGLLIGEEKQILTGDTGGTSQGDANAGHGESTERVFKELNRGDKAGAGILTAIVSMSAIALFGWLSWPVKEEDEFEPPPPSGPDRPRPVSTLKA